MQQYDYEIRYIRGKDNKIADYFSRYGIMKIMELKKSDMEINCIQYDRELENLIEIFKNEYTLDTVKLTKQFKEFVEACPNKDPENRPTVKELFKYPYMKRYKKNSYLVDLIDRYKKWKFHIKSLKRYKKNSCLVDLIDRYEK